MQRSPSFDDLINLSVGANSKSALTTKPLQAEPTLRRSVSANELSLPRPDTEEAVEVDQNEASQTWNEKDYYQGAELPTSKALEKSVYFEYKKTVAAPPPKTVSKPKRRRPRPMQPPPPADEDKPLIADPQMAAMETALAWFDSDGIEFVTYISIWGLVMFYLLYYSSYAPQIKSALQGPLGLLVALPFVFAGTIWIIQKIFEYYADDDDDDDEEEEEEEEKERMRYRSAKAERVLRSRSRRHQHDD